MSKPTGVNANKIGSTGTYLKLEYKTASESVYTEIEGLQDCPALGGTVENVEITTFADDAHTYMSGIKNNGDSLAFTILHDKTNFSSYNTAFGSGATTLSWKVTLPDGASGAAGTIFSFSGTATIQFAGASVNGALTDTVTIIPSTSITVS